MLEAKSLSPAKESFRNDELEALRQHATPITTQLDESKTKFLLPIKERVSINELEQARRDWNTASRIDEEATIFFTAIALIFAEVLLDGDDGTATYVSSFIGSMIGVVVASGWFAVRKRLPKKINDSLLTNNLNPWSRRFKTAFVFGQKCGELVGNFVPIPEGTPITHLGQKVIAKILGCLFGIVLGVVGVVFFKGDLSELGEKYLRIGSESWSKYAKTGFVYGSSTGAAIGGLLGTFVFPGLGTSIGIAVGGTIGSIVGFTVAIVGVPLFNHLKSRFHLNDSEHLKYLNNLFSNYRTNYVRAGITFGSCIFAVVGGIIGTFALPGIGTAAGAALGAAIGGVIGGLVLGIAGPFISRYANDSGANSFDYVIRTSAMFGGNVGLGQAMMPCMPILGELCVPAVSAATATAGVTVETLHQHQLKNQRATISDHILPWTQRAAYGVMIGSAIFGLIGFLAFPPFGGFVGAGIGGLVGGIIACAAEPILRKLGCLPTATPAQIKNDERTIPADDVKPSANLNASMLQKSETAITETVPAQNQLRKNTPRVTFKMTCPALLFNNPNPATPGVQNIFLGQMSIAPIITSSPTASSRKF